ncbi:hypothetical protein BDD12DRAFT_879027 [Trichophaea hybrida]|nr:hypothetical protein BDD12DRAFT_879027 [Trichophaea hybrida]
MTSGSPYKPLAQSSGLSSPSNNRNSSSSSHSVELENLGRGGNNNRKNKAQTDISTAPSGGVGRAPPPGQCRIILARLASRLVIDIVLWASFIMAVLYTEKVGALTRYQKHLFNAVGVGLPLMLGLNYNSSFQAMAGIMRWKVLESSIYTFKETDLILSLDSFLTVTKLGIHWSKQMAKKAGKRWMYFGRALACLGWVFLTLGSQIGVGLLGLTFDFNSENALIPEPGKVWVTNLATYSRTAPLSIPVAVGITTINEEQYRAHQYGDLGDQFVKESNASSNVKIPSYGSNISITWLEGGSAWEYRFQDWTGTQQDPRQQSIPSDRIITVKTNCTIIHWNQLWNTSHHLNWSQVKYEDIAPDGVTFLNFDTDGKQKEFWCDNRCARIGGVATTWYEGGSGLTNDTSQWNATECDVAISSVSNTGNATYYELSDEVAQLAAGAIAMDGIARLTQDSYQFYRYNNRTTWGSDFVDKNEVAKRVGRFAAGSIALLDFYGGTLDHEVDGTKVLIGVKLTAKRPQLWIVMGILVGVHFILLPVVLYFGNTAPYADGSHLSTAILFNSVLNEVQHEKKFIKSKELHKEKTYKTSFMHSEEGPVLVLRPAE